MIGSGKISSLKYGGYTLRCKPQNHYSKIGFHYYKTIFFHIPKTGGVSVSKSLFRNLGMGHIDVLNARDSFPGSDFENYFKFSFVRNPYTRLMSAYIFLKNGGFDERDRKWSNDHLKDYNSFEDFVLNWLTPDNCMLKNHFKPQWSFICDPNTKRIAMNYVGRFESLAADYSFVAGKLKIRRKLMLENISNAPKMDYRCLKDEVKKQIVLCYKDDFNLFDYHKAL